MGVEIFKLVLGLLAVGALMWFAYRKASSVPGFGGAGHLKMVERHQVTRNSAVVVFRDGDERVVIGAGDSGVVELSRTEWVEPAASAAKVILPAAGQKFGEILSKAVGKPNK